MENGEEKPTEELLPKTAEEAWIVLRDGKDISGKMDDGTSETVKVRLIAQKDYPTYSHCLYTEVDEHKEAELYTGKPSEWVKRMAPDFFDAVLEEGQLLNFRHFKPWLKRRMRKFEVLGGANPQLQMVMDRATSIFKEQSTSSSSRTGTGKPTSGPTPPGN